MTPILQTRSSLDGDILTTRQNGTPLDSSGPEKDGIRVAIAVEVRFYRDDIADILMRHGLKVVASVATGDRVVSSIAEADPHVLLIDTALRGGIDAVAMLSSRYPGMKIVAIGLQETVENVLKWGEAGAAGYVTQESSGNELVAIIQEVVRNELRCGSHIAAGMIRRLGHLARTARGALAASDPPLTPRQTQILSLIEQGLSNKEIARKLGIELATAKTHVHNVLEKLNVRGRGQAAALHRRSPDPRVEM